MKLVIAVGGDVPGTMAFQDVMERGETMPACRRPRPDPFLLLYTSGTTSSPKAVSVTFNHFLSNARMCAAEFDIRPDDRILCLAPYTHLYGLYALQLGFSVGATACLLDVFTPPGLVERSSDEADDPDRRAGPCRALPAAEPVSGRRFLRHAGRGAVRIDGAGRLVGGLRGADAERPGGAGLGHDRAAIRRVQPAVGRARVRFDTIGRATPGTELRVADADDRELPRGEVGELHVRGCSLFSGYVGNQEATRARFTEDGWLRTGDLASMDEQGNVRLRGRTKELINRGGVKWNPIDMEIAIAGHPAVAQVAIAPVPDPLLGERASCFVVLKTGASLSFDELKAYLAERKFAKFTWPEQLAIVREMPMTPTRKVMKAELVKQYLESEAAPP